MLPSLLLFISCLVPQAAVGAIELDRSLQQPSAEAYVAPFTVMRQPPTVPKVDFNACPFEGCQFGTWTVRKAVKVYSTWRNNRRQIATLPEGEKVTALTGVNIVIHPGKGVFTRDVQMYGAKRGDVAYTYNYCGEGAIDVWTHGRFIRCAELMFSEKSGWGCQRDCDGRYLELGKFEWWANIRMENGKTGWVLVSDNFDGTDALA